MPLENDAPLSLQEAEKALCDGTPTPMKMTIRDVIRALKEKQG